MLTGCNGYTHQTQRVRCLTHFELLPMRSGICELSIILRDFDTECLKSFIRPHRRYLKQLSFCFVLGRYSPRISAGSTALSEVIRCSHLLVTNESLVLEITLLYVPQTHVTVPYLSVTGTIALQYSSSCWHLCRIVPNHKYAGKSLAKKQFYVGDRLYPVHFNNILCILYTHTYYMFRLAWSFSEACYKRTSIKGPMNVG